MKNLTIDSSVFVSAFLETDTFHDESKRFFYALQEHEVLVIEPVIVALEVLNVLTRVSTINVVSVRETFATYQSLPLDTEMIEEALFAFRKCRLKTSDALIVWCASVSESTLVSWDNQLLREAGKLVPACKPSQYIRDR